MAYPRNEDDTEALVAADKLRGFVAEIERSDDRIKSENEHKSDIFKNAKKEGFNVKALRKVIAARRMDDDDRAKLDGDFDLYMMHVGDLAHAHVENIEEIPPHDEDGVILEDNEPAPPAKPEVAADSRQGSEHGPSVALPADTQSTEQSNEADAASAPVEPSIDELGDGNGLRLKGEATAKIDGAAGIPSVGSRESGSMAEGASTQREDGASPSLHPNPIRQDDPVDAVVDGTQPVSDRHIPEPGDGDAGESPAPASEPAADDASSDVSFAVPGSIRTERVPAVGVVWHDYLRCFPEYWSKQLADFTEEVRANGITTPILMQGNIVIDGRARYNAARHLGLEYQVEEYAGDDPLRDIINLNMASRSLNLVERQNVAKKLIKLVPDRADEIGELLDLNQSREAANENFGSVEHRGSINA